MILWRLNLNVEGSRKSELSIFFPSRNTVGVLFTLRDSQSFISLSTCARYLSVSRHFLRSVVSIHIVESVSTLLASVTGDSFLEISRV